jgi:hypothetical protein
MRVRRTGPPEVVEVMGTAHRFAVPLDRAPSPAWWMRFQSAKPIDGATPLHVALSRDALVFQSTDAHVMAWLTRIDTWIDAANTAPQNPGTVGGIFVLVLLLLTGKANGG